MKNIIFFIFLTLSFTSCVKHEIKPTERIPAPVVIKNYTAYIYPGAYHKDGDSLIVKVNNITVTSVTTIPVSFSLAVKTGDKLYIRYNPGLVEWNGGWIVDENAMQVFIDGEEVAQVGCGRCVYVYNEVVK